MFPNCGKKIRGHSHELILGRTVYVNIGPETHLRKNTGAELEKIGFLHSFSEFGSVICIRC